MLRAEGAGQGRAESCRHDGGQTLAGKLPAGEEAPPLRLLLSEKSGCDAEFSAGGEALNEPRRNDQRRREGSDLGIGRRHRYDAGAESHQQDGQGKRRFASVLIRKAAEHDGAKRTHEKGDAESAERNEK